MDTNQQQQAEQAAGWLGGNPEEYMDRFSLQSVTSSKEFPAQKIVIYGVPAIGKTTFASTFPKPILLRTEDGACALDVPTFPKLVENLKELERALAALHGGHDFKTLVIDSLDWLEPLVFRYVCQQEGKLNIEDFGYGKGYMKADDIWRRVLSKIDNLRVSKSMNIVSIAHAVPVVFDAPDADAYQRYQLKLQKRGTALWMEWADITLFLNYQVSVIANQDKGTNKAHGTDDRIIYTQERPAFQAKSRWPLPGEIYIGKDAKWAEFHKQLSEATEGHYHV